MRTETSHHAEQEESAVHHGKLLTVRNFSLHSEEASMRVQRAVLF